VCILKLVVITAVVAFIFHKLNSGFTRQTVTATSDDANARARDCCLNSVLIFTVISATFVCQVTLYASGRAVLCGGIRCFVLPNELYAQ
jgi:hypothetical protein